MNLYMYFWFVFPRSLPEIKFKKHESTSKRVLYQISQTSLTYHFLEFKYSAFYVWKKFSVLIQRNWGQFFSPSQELNLRAVSFRVPPRWFICSLGLWSRSLVSLRTSQPVSVTDSLCAALAPSIHYILVTREWSVSTATNGPHLKPKTMWGLVAPVWMYY